MKLLQEQCHGAPVYIVQLPWSPATFIEGWGRLEILEWHLALVNAKLVSGSMLMENGFTLAKSTGKLSEVSAQGDKTVG